MAIGSFLDIQACMLQVFHASRLILRFANMRQSHEWPLHLFAWYLVNFWAFQRLRFTSCQRWLKNFSWTAYEMATHDFLSCIPTHAGSHLSMTMDGLAHIVIQLKWIAAFGKLYDRLAALINGVGHTPAKSKMLIL